MAAFCSNCGNQLEGNERFCVKCGKDQKPSAAAPAPPVAATPVMPPPPPTPPMIPMPGPYGAPPGVIPIAMAMPPAPAKKSGMTGTIIVLLVLAVGGYYAYKHFYKPPVPPPKTGQDQALTKQQAFDAHWDNVNGFVQISNGKWTNNSTQPIQSAILECDQYDSGKNDLDQMRTTLNGPLQPGAVDSFNAFQMGAVANNLNSVTCTIVHVKLPDDSQQQ